MVILDTSFINSLFEEQDSNHNEAKKITTKFLLNNEDDITFVKDLPYAIRKKLKANDCMIMALTVRKKAQLITFDENLFEALSTR